jgi:Fibrinogen beta and gamma chains, C-terminal globular domain
MKAKDDGKFYVANYGSFVVYDETTNYLMYVSGYSGNASDSFSAHSGMMFTTKDRDNDRHQADNCATTTLGGFWYYLCGFANVNGQMDINCFFWRGLPSVSTTYLSHSEMWIRC